MKKRLTDALLSKTKPPPGKNRLDISDDVAKGLSARIYASRVKFSFTYRYAGKQERVTYKGQWPDVSLTQARQMTYENHRLLAHNINPKAHIKEQERLQTEAEEEGITVKELGEQFIELYAKPHTKEWVSTQRMLKNHVYPTLGNKRAYDLVELRKEFVKLLDELKASKRPTAANHVKSALSKMYSWAKDRGVVEYNPFLGMKKPFPVQDRERVLNDDEIKRFWWAAEQLGYPYGPLLQILLLTGQRCREISTIKREYVDFKNKVIKIPAGNTKANRGHDVPLSDLAVSILKSLPRFNGPYIFSTSHGEKPVNGFSKAKVRIKRYFLAPDWRFHDLRRTAGTNMAQLGVSLHTFSRVFNHSEGGVTQIYARYSYLSEKREALDLWSDHVWNIVHDSHDENANVVPLKGAL